jgi:tetratricopeptide (TPR) repeat protein
LCPDLALVQATAARLRGEPAAAVALLEPLVRGPLGAERYTVRLELARGYRDVANYPGARAAYAELSALKNPAVRLEAAQLLLEDRDPKGAREHIEALLRDAGEKITGLALVEAMRIRTLTGGAVAAEALADKAFKAGAPPWMLQREAARIAARRGDVPAAVAAVTKALDGSKADIDTLLLACDLVEGAPEAFVAKVSKAVDERLAGVPDQQVAQGKLALARGERDQAAELFARAAQDFMKKPASARRLAQASFGVGAVAALRGDWVKAKLKLEAALELDPSLVDAYLYQAEALASSGALKAAIARLKVASEYNPESIVVWQLLERRASEAGEAKTAGEAARRIQELSRKPT